MTNAADFDWSSLGAPLPRGRRLPVFVPHPYAEVTDTGMGATCCCLSQCYAPLCGLQASPPPASPWQHMKSSKLYVSLSPNKSILHYPTHVDTLDVHQSHAIPFHTLHPKLLVTATSPRGYRAAAMGVQDV